jgi:tRNA pseudouridine38-40 synthase
MRIAVGVSYDGLNYCGWQSQSSGCGVQDFVERAIAKIAGHEVRVHAAGRTDAGVHALCQVIHFDTDALRPNSAWVRGVNRYLPDTVRIEWASVVDEAFHARFKAFSRSYEYLLYNAPVSSATMASKAGWFHLPLEVGLMQEGANFLLGEHDFSAFRAANCQAKTPVKTMHVATVSQVGDYFKFSFSANAFLYHQVRNIVGALVYVGKGAHPPSVIKTLLAQHDRNLSPPTFSPAGLYLTGVGYDEKWSLPITKTPTKSIQLII